MGITRVVTSLLAGFLLWSYALADQGCKVTVLFFNDLHGHLQPFTVKDDQGATREVGGIARMATLVKRIRSENQRKGQKTLLLVAGDILQGTPMSTVYQGQADVAVLNAMGVNAMTVGNHEFDFGLANFQALQQQARFPFLSSNLVWKKSQRPLVRASVSFPVAPRLRLHVLGATTPELLTTTRPDNVMALGAQDPVDTIQAAYVARRGGGPALLLSHCAHATDRAIATRVPELSAILAGHDQVLFNPHRNVGPVPIFQAFEKGKFLGRIDLELHRHDPRARLCEWTYLPVDTSVPADPKIQTLVEGYQKRLDGAFKVVVGECRTFLDGERGRIRYEETTLGDFVADTMREALRTDIALINAGALRASIEQGPVTVESIFKAMPYPNELVVAQVPGRLLTDILTRAVKHNRDEEDGGFLHISGLRIEVQGTRLQQLTVQGQPVDPDHVYTVAITDFMASGGDGYTHFKGLPLQNMALPLRELLVDTVRKRRIIDATLDGRIKRVAGPATSFNACIATASQPVLVAVFHPAARPILKGHAVRPPSERSARKE